MRQSTISGGESGTMIIWQSMPNTGMRIKKIFMKWADEILASAKGYRTFEEWFAHIEEYRQELKGLAQEKRRNQNAVTFATLHSAKGLEFPKVCI